MAARELTVDGVPVLMYHGVATSAPATVDARERKYWVSTATLRRHLVQIRLVGLKTGRLDDLRSHL